MLTLAMRRTPRDIPTVSSSETLPEDEEESTSTPLGDPPAYHQVRRQQRQSRDATSDNVTQQIITSGGEEYVDILQVQQLLLENAGVSNAGSASYNGSSRSGAIGHLHRTVEHHHLEAAVRGRMLIESYPPGVPPPTLHHPAPPPPPPPYYYANYVQQQQHQAPSVEDLFALWLGSSPAGLFLFYLTTIEACVINLIQVFKAAFTWLGGSHF
ncbi:hypothetical protein C0J52_11975 [Blattella germanica]|nr:hypothetical protein C0J52_11975 [Blattella germanica]